MEFLTLDELSELIKLPKTFVYGHTRKGSPDPIPGYRFGKHLRFRKDEIEKWVNRHRKAQN